MAKDSLQDVRDQYDVIVVGAGLGGLTAANTLARAGRSVLLLEQHFKLGGLATWFRRPGGHIFDVALHGFPVGMIKSCRRYWSREIADSIVQLKNIRFDNPMFSLSTTFDREDFTRLLVERFGVAAETVGRFFDAAREHELLRRPVAHARASCSSGSFPAGEDVVRLLMEPITYANGSTLEDPALSYGIVFSNFMSKGVYTFQGGTDRLMRADGAGTAPQRRRRPHRRLQASRRSRPRAAASQGVVVERPRDPSPRRRLQRQPEGHHLQPRGRRGLGPRLPRAGPGGPLEQFQHPGLHGPAAGRNDRRGRLRRPVVQFHRPGVPHRLLLSRNVTSRTYSFYYPRTRPGRNRCLIVASTNARYGDWAGLSKEAYEDAKRDLVENTLDAVAKYVPDIRQKLAWVECSTPLTFERYTRHLDGASFGTKFEGLAVSRAMPQQIAGLYHAGSVGIIMSGLARGGQLRRHRGQRSGQLLDEGGRRKAEGGRRKVKNERRKEARAGRTLSIPPYRQTASIGQQQPVRNHLFFQRLAVHLKASKH